MFLDESVEKIHRTVTDDPERVRRRGGSCNILLFVTTQPSMADALHDAL